MTAEQMRLWFYKKVVLSASPRLDSYAAMLILHRPYGVPAFATAEDPNWRIAPSQDGVEDAIHHDGRFYSITYSGVVEVWDRDIETGEFKSTAVAPPLVVVTGHRDKKLLCKYLAATLDGRLMVVLKGTKQVEEREKRYGYSLIVMEIFFEVQGLDVAQGRWEKLENIGDARRTVRGRERLSMRVDEGAPDDQALLRLLH
ncbi:hypothetical protein ACP70R_009253 [Stipagrostis hirtigluma subsp. patula]